MKKFLVLVGLTLLCFSLYAQEKQLKPVEQQVQTQSGIWYHAAGVFDDFKDGVIYCHWNPDCLCYSISGNVIVIHEPCDEESPIDHQMSIGVYFTKQIGSAEVIFSKANTKK